MADCGTFTPPSTDPTAVKNALLDPYKNNVARPTVKFNVAEDVTLDSDNHVPASALQSKFAALQSGGFLSATPASGLNSTTTVEDRIKKDREFVAALHAEFCFYYTRWVYALNQWITAATSSNAATASAQQTTDMLATLRTLNVRCIYMIEFSSYVAQQRIPPAQADASSIAALNEALNAKLISLTAANKRFSDDKAIVTTQREMVRYTASKNATTVSSIIFWVGTNVVALGLIGYMYVKT